MSIYIKRGMELMLHALELKTTGVNL